MTKIGTLAEIGAKPGDVVEAQDGDYPKYVVGKNYRGNRIGTDDSVKLEMNLLYRIVSRAPEKPEPKVETVTLYGSPVKHIQWCLEQCAIDTHRITFNLIDGEPDCTSIKMEKL